MSMASNYNSRPRPAEVLIDGDRALEVRAREDTQSLFALEKRLADAQAR
jgi:diaminopimelate decarboxylase